jgi:hypothetical protein
MKLSKLKEIIRENIKEIKYGKGQKGYTHCVCCPDCGGTIGPGQPYTNNCQALCDQMCNDYCYGNVEMPVIRLKN